MCVYVCERVSQTEPKIRVFTCSLECLFFVLGDECIMFVCVCLCLHLCFIVCVLCESVWVIIWPANGRHSVCSLVHILSLGHPLCPNLRFMFSAIGLWIKDFKCPSITVIYLFLLQIGERGDNLVTHPAKSYNFFLKRSLLPGYGWEVIKDSRHNFYPVH